jgi:hypothetical protein
VERVIDHRLVGANVRVCWQIFGNRLHTPDKRHCRGYFCPILDGRPRLRWYPNFAFAR